MNNVFKYTCKNGLNVTFIKRLGFIKKYAAIGAYYGGADLEFKYKGKKYKSPMGIAHFLEHKKFRLPDGNDAMALFYSLNANNNAYTGVDRTIYFFDTDESIYEALTILIKLYFNPVFIPDDVEKEKGIISTEMHMSYNDPIYCLGQKAFENAYPNDNISTEIYGTDESINSITPDDLMLAYNAFYTPENSQMVIVGDLDENELFSFIEKETKPYKNRKTATKINPYKSKKSAKPLIYEDKTNQDLVCVTLRMDDITNKDGLSCDMLVGVLDNFLSVSSPFYQELDSKHLFEGDIDYSVATYNDTSYAFVFAASKKPLALAKAIINKINNLDELADEQIELYLKHIKARSINCLDNIERLGDSYMNSILEGNDYFEIFDKLIDTKKEDLYKYLESVKAAKKTYTICKKNA